MNGIVSRWGSAAGISATTGLRNTGYVGINIIASKAIVDNPILIYRNLIDGFAHITGMARNIHSPFR
jgi:hypothetical protein